MTNHRLKWWYEKINREAFGGRLPSAMVRYGRLTGDTAACTYMVEVSKDFDRATLLTFKRESRRIKENPKLVAKVVPIIVIADTARRWPNQSFTSLIHEMVHTAHPKWDCPSSTNDKKKQRRYAREFARVAIRCMPQIL